MPQKPYSDAAKPVFWSFRAHSLRKRFVVMISSKSTASTSPRILVLPKPSLYRILFSPESDQRLRGLGAVEIPREERDMGSDELAERIGAFDVVVSGWRAPKFTDAVLTNAKRLKLIAHSAGSVKFMLDEAAFERGIQVTNVAAAMAPPVAEMTLLFIMLALRPVHAYDRQLKSGEDWKAVKGAGTSFSQEIAGQRIGIIGTGHVGRAVIKTLRGVQAHMVAYDPYLTDSAAEQLGVERAATLDDLLRTCRIISLHAPATPETHHMIGKRELAMLADGAIVVNTARSWCIDGDALLEELRTGRLRAALDVFDEEPLPPDSPLRKLDNVILTPHLGAATRQCQLRQGAMTVDEVERFVTGKPLRYPVTVESLPLMA
jgi:phosphoglycerate dehydrogenase-like enzyme